MPTPKEQTSLLLPVKLNQPSSQVGPPLSERMADGAKDGQIRASGVVRTQDEPRIATETIIINLSADTQPQITGTTRRTA